MVAPVPKMDPEKYQLGVTTKEGLQVFSPLVVTLVPKLDPKSQKVSLGWASRQKDGL